MENHKRTPPPAFQGSVYGLAYTLPLAKGRLWFLGGKVYGLRGGGGWLNVCLFGRGGVCLSGVGLGWLWRRWGEGRLRMGGAFPSGAVLGTS